MLEVLATHLMMIGLFVVFIVALFASHWLMCRLTAKRCPKCGSKWKTSLVGEWGDEHWRCAACGHGWFVPYAPSRKGGA